MKKLIRHYAIETYGLWLVTQIASGLVFDKGIQTLLIAGVGLTIASLVAKPVINLLLIPLNLVTFNIFKWVSSAIVIYLVTLVVPGFRVAAFIFDGFTSRWIDIPQLHFQGILAYVGFAFTLSLITALIHWLAK